MDIELLRTFLEVDRTRHFGRAAENLFLTPSAISARIRQLEELIGVPLFVRQHHNLHLTPAGHRLRSHAEAILAAWNRARQEVVLEEGRDPLTVAGIDSLWDVVLQPWLLDLRRHHPELAIRAEAHSAETLIRKLLDDALDIAFLFDPPQMEELNSETVATLQLILVASRPGLDATAALASDYLMVDWGSAFRIQHQRQHPNSPPPLMHIGPGRIALACLLEQGGSAYLPQSCAAPLMASGQLHPVSDNPAIERPVHALWSRRNNRQAVIRRVLGRFESTHR